MKGRSKNEQVYSFSCLFTITAITITAMNSSTAPRIYLKQRCTGLVQKKCQYGQLGALTTAGASNNT